MSTPVVDSERETLEAGLQGEFWKLVTAQIDREWGAVGFAEKLGRTLGDPNINPAIALAQLQQATVAQKAALSIREWPAQRIQQLKRQAQPQEANMSRRGPGL